MFGGAPPAPSKEQVEEQEKVANRTIQTIVLSSIALYLSPFAIDYMRNLF